MLRGSTSLGADLATWLRRKGCLNVRHITTNTAIQRGLRKPSIPFGANRTSNPVAATSGFPPRTFDDRPPRTGGRFRPSKASSPDRPSTLRTKPVSPLDPDRPPKNRAERRALEFGHPVKPRTSTHASVASRRLNRLVRSASINNGGRGEDAFSSAPRTPNKSPSRGDTERTGSSRDDGSLSLEERPPGRFEKSTKVDRRDTEFDDERPSGRYGKNTNRDSRNTLELETEHSGRYEKNIRSARRNRESDEDRPSGRYQTQTRIDRQDAENVKFNPSRRPHATSNSLDLAICYNCGGEGHLSRDCPEERRHHRDRLALQNDNPNKEKSSKPSRAYPDGKYEVGNESFPGSSGGPITNRHSGVTNSGHYGSILDGVKNLNRHGGANGKLEDRSSRDGRQVISSHNGSQTMIDKWTGEGATKDLQLSKSAPRNIGRESARAFLAPRSIPYTTAASEFLYGYSVVTAAIKADRRELYNLYCHPRVERHEGFPALQHIARATDVRLQLVDDSWLPLMDKMSSGRPHNGVILESSPLPRPPITSLGASSKEDDFFKVVLSHQSKEDLAINGEREKYDYNSDNWRHPFILYADGVTDEGNLGAIVRAAYFLGVDAIALPTRTSAPLSHIALKASAGAAEAIPIFAVADPTTFLRDSSEAGWRIYAADAPTPLPIAPFGFGLDSSDKVKAKKARDAREFHDAISFSYKSGKPFADAAPLTRHPTILMMGSEGTGIKASLMAKAHFKVGIRGARGVGELGIDSLNVSVASALLCAEFMKKPKVERKMGGGFLF